MPQARPAVPFIALLAVLLVIDSGLRVVRSGDALPGTKVAGVDVGGVSEDEARERLTQASEQPILFGNTPVIPARAGVAWDVERTLERVEDAGRGGPLGITEGLRSLLGGRDVVPTLDPDTRAQRRTVDALAERIDKPANSGGFRIDPQTIVATISAPKTGKKVDEKLLLERMRTASVSEDRSIEIPIDTLPAQPRRLVEAVAREAERYLEGPLTVTAGGEKVVIEPALLAPAMRMTTTGKPRLSLPSDALAPVLDKISGALDRPAKAPRISRGGESVSLTEKGSVKWEPREVEVDIAAGRSGRRVNRGKAVQSIGDAVRAGRHRVSVRREKEASPITPAQAERIDSVIGTFTTPYIGGQPRVKNIQRIARAVDGTIIAPGGQFSLNAAAGERTADKGYVEAPFIAEGNRLEPAVGGGVSQFSTTLYNAAYFAGLPINESTPHTLYIDRYPPGRETTLNFGSIDLRFTNDTETPIVIQTSYTDSSVTVHLLGDNGGRRVAAEAGDREPVDGGDFRITVTRLIRFPDGRLVKQPRTTTYQTEAAVEAAPAPAPTATTAPEPDREPEPEDEPEREPEPRPDPAPEPAPESSSGGGAKPPG